jgi:stress-induced morphogen
VTRSRAAFTVVRSSTVARSLPASSVPPEPPDWSSWSAYAASFPPDQDSSVGTAILAVSRVTGRSVRVGAGERVFPPRHPRTGMDTDEVERLITDALPGARATVSPQRGPDDDHLAAVVVSPAFEGETLVDQHRLVYDALGEHMTTDIHALELKTYTPEEYADADVEADLGQG